MIRTIVAAALAGAVLQGGALRAQDSDNHGLMLGLHAVPMGLDGVGEETFSDQGMGLGFTLGWGFSTATAGPCSRASRPPWARSPKPAWPTRPSCIRAASHTPTTASSWA